MTTPVRTAGLRGRLPKRPVTDRLPLRWVHDYVSLPDPVYPVDVSGGITDFGMDGNGPDPTCTTHPDGVGDCTFAARQHNRQTKAAAYGQTETWETSNALVAEYLAYDHGRDIGANIADLLLSWYRAGKILAFAPVDHTDPSACNVAMLAFHGLYCGVNLTDDADDLFSEGEPWTVADGQQPDPDDGHCIVKVGTDGTPLMGISNGVAYDTWVTWGALQKSTLDWTTLCLDEAWVIVAEEDEMDASALAALRADINALGGTGGAPDPAPTPAPSPTPADADTEMWATAGPWCAEDRTRPDLVVLKGALKDWASAKGL